MTQRRLWIALAMLLAIVGGLWLVTPVAHAWLAAFVAFSLWPLGSLAVLFIHALSGGRWGEALRPGLVLGAAATPWIAPLAIPVLLSLPALYPWARPEGAALPNRFWLNPGFFALRGTIDLVVWIGLATLVQRGRPLRRVAPFALLALALTVTFAAIDLTMSLEPRFTSSAYGMIAGASAIVFAMAAAILVAPPPAEARDDVGRLLLALCALWTYLDFMQLLIVWQNDLVTQVPWYRTRARGLWGWAMAAIALAHGIGPILALMLPAVRRSEGGLRAVAWVLVGAALVRSWWTVLPPAAPGPAALACMGVMAAAALLLRARHA